MDPHPLYMSVDTFFKACHLSSHPPMGRSCPGPPLATHLWEVPFCVRILIESSFK